MNYKTKIINYSLTIILSIFLITYIIFSFILNLEIIFKNYLLFILICNVLILILIIYNDEKKINTLIKNNFKQTKERKIL